MRTRFWLGSKLLAVGRIFVPDAPQGWFRSPAGLYPRIATFALGRWGFCWVGFNGRKGAWRG